MTSPAPQVFATADMRAIALVERVASAWKRWRNRRQVAALLSLDEHLLADLGVARGDVFEALSGPALGDASAALGACAARARQNETMRLRESLRSARVLNLTRPAAAPQSAPAATGHRAA